MEPVPEYTSSVGEELKALTASGALTADAEQIAVAAKLDHILTCLRETRPAKKKSALGWLFAKGGGKPRESAASTSMAASVAARPC